MENSTSVIVVAGEGEMVLAPKEFTGVIKKVNRMQQRAVAGQSSDDTKVWLSLTIEGLPPLVDKNGNKITILRTPKQAENDLRYFSDLNAGIDSLEIDMDIYATGREVTFDVSAHQAGAILTVTEGSYYTTDDGGGYEVGETIEMKSAGFYIEGFLDIAFAKEDKLARKEQLRVAELSARKSSLSSTPMPK